MAQYHHSRERVGDVHLHMTTVTDELPNVCVHSESKALLDRPGMARKVPMGWVCCILLLMFYTLSSRNR